MFSIKLHRHLARSASTTMIALAVFSAGPAAFAGQTIPPEHLAGLKWRNIGPFRGGRVSAVSGVPGQSATFYIGLPEGGVWKTTSAGQTWYPVFDAVRDTACVGSVQVAPSDANVVYAGTGEISGGGDGTGIYGSRDAGQTWHYLGLKETTMIPSLLVDAHDPNVVLAAAMGPSREQSDQRGVFRTTDGGKTWTKTLYIDKETGIQHLARAYDEPNTIIATSDRRFFNPGSFRGGSDDRPSGTAMYKSTDEGLTWKKLEPKGLPRIDGRVCVAIAAHTNAQRVFLIGTFGLYRSDDGGANWRRMAADDWRIANGQGYYTSGVYVDSNNPDIVYTLATCVYRSVDGGKSFDAFKGAPDGDDPQQMWIDPTDGNRILLGGDQGAVVSLDAGKTWGSWYNQATGQIYHIGVSNDWPYWVYGTQQDSGGIGTASRGNLAQITPTDWTPHPGSEGGRMVVDPVDSRFTYCEGPGGLVRVMFPTMQSTPINPPSALGSPNWFGFSAGNPHELLGGSEFLLASTDRGEHWRKLSPNLVEAPGAQPPTGPQARFRRFTSISAVAASPLDGSVIWVGTSNGLIKLTRDHGRTWTDVSLPKDPKRARLSIGALAAAPRDKAEAYVVIAAPFGGDVPAAVYRTVDFGKTWTTISHGLTAEAGGRGSGEALACDDKQNGLLFFATGNDVFFSRDDGDHWQTLNQNLPVTRLSDLVVHGDDLVLSTFGRGLWILDDFSPLREISPATVGEAAHLFAPATAVRVRRNMNQDTPYPPEVPHAKNPPLGAVIDYSLATKPNGLVTLEILDKSGQAVRHYSSAPVEPYTDRKPPEPDWWFEPRLPLPTQVGLNRINWDLRYDIPPALFHNPDYPGPAAEHDTPFAIEGPLVVPGTYTARLTVDGKSFTQPITVVNDPRSFGSQKDIEAMHAVQMQLYVGAREAYEGYEQVSAMRKAIAGILADKPTDDVAKAAKTLDETLGALVGDNRIQGGLVGRAPGDNFGGQLASQLDQMTALDNGDAAPSEGVEYAAGEEWARITRLAARWRELTSKELKGVNDLLAKHGLKAIDGPGTSLVDPAAPPKRFIPPPPKPGRSEPIPAARVGVKDAD